MFDFLVNFLGGKIGRNAVGLATVLIAGGVGFYYITDFFMTTDAFCKREENIYIAMERGDTRTMLEILNMKIESARTEKMKLENFIDIQQDGQCTERQRLRLNELIDTINRLEAKRDILYKKLINTGD